MKVYHLSDAAT